MRAAIALVKSLEKLGVKHIFGITGAMIIPVFDALYDSNQIRYIHMRNEQAASYAADGYARASGEPGVCIATSGPGATNLVTGVVNAYMDSSPLIAITGQVGRGMIGTDAFQEADMVGVLMPHVKHNYLVMNAKELVDIVRQAFKIATTGRPGPVHIDIPVDVQMVDIEFDEKIFETEVKLRSKSQLEPDMESIKKAADLLIKAERPIIIAGGGAIWSNASKQLISLAEYLAIPVATASMGKGVIPENHPLALGVVGLFGTKVGNRIVNDSDLILAIGTRFADRLTGERRTFIANRKLIHIDVDPAELGKVYPPNVAITGDAGRVLTRLLEVVSKMVSKDKYKDSPRVREIAEMKKALASKMDYDDIPLKPQRVIKEMREALPRDAIVTTGVGQHQMCAIQMYEALGPRTFITSGGLAPMGFGLPSAIGAKLAKPDRVVLDIDSDGSMMMTGNEIATSVVHNVPVIIALFDNRKYTLIRQVLKMAWRERYIGEDIGSVPDFVKYAESFNARAQRITRPEEIRPAIKESIGMDETMLLDIIVDPEAMVSCVWPPGKPLTERIEF